MRLSGRLEHEMRKRAFWTMLLAILVLGGIFAIKLVQRNRQGKPLSDNRSWKPLSIMQGSRTSRVEIFSPPYGENARSPDTVTVLWDGDIIFKGALPISYSGLDGIPVVFAQFQFSPGSHVLQIESNGVVEKKAFDIDAGQTRYFHIFGIEDRRETLLKDYGTTAPMFH
jgi:hypothetical protein